MRKTIVLLAGVLLFYGIVYATPQREQTGLAEEVYLREAEQGLQFLKAEYPGLYKYSQRLFEIRKEIDKIMNDYRNGAIHKSAAMEKIEPLVEEELQIRNNPDFQMRVRTMRILTEPAFLQP